MRYMLFFMLLLVGCTTSKVGEVDYCHNLDGTYNSDDPRCAHNFNPIIFKESIHDNSDKR